MAIETGVYETAWGNAAIVMKGRAYAYDLDMGQKIPLASIDFTQKIREVDEEDLEVFPSWINKKYITNWSHITQFQA